MTNFENFITVAELLAKVGALIAIIVIPLHLAYVNGSAKHSDGCEVTSFMVCERSYPNNQ